MNSLLDGGVGSLTEMFSDLILLNLSVITCIIFTTIVFLLHCYHLIHHILLHNLHIRQIYAIGRHIRVALSTGCRLIFETKIRNDFKFDKLTLTPERSLNRLFSRDLSRLF